MGLAALGGNAAVLALAVLVLLVVAYDMASLRRVHGASLWAAPLTFAVSALTAPVAATAWWREFAVWLARTVAPHV
jgi:hypothetical protein